MAGIYLGSTLGGTAIVAYASGPNTGDEMIKTADGQWWLLVTWFPLTRATGERRGVMCGHFVFDV